VEGESVHRVSGGASHGTEIVLAEFRGSTRDGEWLTQTSVAPVSRIRYVRATTLESRSIAAWPEIQVLAPGATPSPLAAGPRCAATPAPTHPVGPVVENGLDDGREVRAPSATAAGPPSGAFDGLVDTSSNAGWFPPAWIEVDLGKENPATVTSPSWVSWSEIVSAPRETQHLGRRTRAVRP